ncbi:MAG: MlaD family protein [Proteobacteria bacterium]|nr:MlaD family protein [Pseudomonadota bacterium]
MWKQLGTEFKVGVFTIVSLVTLGYMLFVLNPNLLKDSNRKKYHTILNDAAGIVPKTHVKTNGVTVGKVYDVALEVNSTKITIEVDSNIKIPKGSHIEVRTRGLLGDVYLEIVRVADTGEYINEGELIQRSQDQMDMGGLVQLAGQIGKDVKQITGTLAGVIGSKNGEMSVRNILDNIEQLTADLRKSGAAIRGAIGDNPEAVENIVLNLDKTLVNLRKFSANLNDVLDDQNKDKLNRIIASFDDSMVDVKGATKNIRLISEKIEKGEGTIGRLINDDTTLDQIEGAVKDIREALGAANKTQIIVDGHGEFRNDKTSQMTLNLKFQTRPDRFYLIGVTDGSEGVTDTTTETMDQQAANGDQPAYQKTRERVSERKALKINLQMAKRWYFFTARIGLFDSTGGVATDMHFFSDKLQLSLEAFDWKTYKNEWRRVARLKTYASILFFNHIYAMVGADDLTRHRNPMTYERQKGPVAFGGMGLTFNDQDLKSLFGAAALAK